MDISIVHTRFKMKTQSLQLLNLSIAVPHPFDLWITTAFYYIYTYTKSSKTLVLMFKNKILYYIQILHSKYFRCKERSDPLQLVWKLSAADCCYLQ